MASRLSWTFAFSNWIVASPMQWGMDKIHLCSSWWSKASARVRFHRPRVKPSLAIRYTNKLTPIPLKLPVYLRVFKLVRTSWHRMWSHVWWNIGGSSYQFKKYKHTSKRSEVLRFTSRTNVLMQHSLTLFYIVTISNNVQSWIITHLSCRCWFCRCRCIWPLNNELLYTIAGISDSFI